MRRVAPDLGPCVEMSTTGAAWPKTTLGVSSREELMITNHSKPPQQALLLVLRRGRSRERGRWALPEI